MHQLKIRLGQLRCLNSFRLVELNKLSELQKLQQSSINEVETYVYFCDTKLLTLCKHGKVYVYNLLEYYR